MSIDNQDKLKIQQNDRNYIIIIGIEEDQLSLILNLLSNPPKKYSGFFSLNELRISSKIFNHTETLFEAKEIIKRTVIKKQILIEENEHRANLTFDPGLGHDSVPFPITLFRDSTEKHPFIPLDNSNIGRPKDNPRNSTIRKTNKMGNVNNNNNMNQQNNTYDDTQSNITNNTILRASIGNNVNNQMLFQNNNANNNTIQKDKLKNIEFNNSVKRFNNNKNINNRYSNGLNNNNNINSQKNIFNENKEFYKKVDLENNFNNVNNVKSNNKDYIALNNNILYKIYNNMNNANNINSSFYRNLQNSFNHTNFNTENLNYVQNNINANNINNNNNNNYVNNVRQNIRNIDNNSMNQPILQQNKKITENTDFKNLNNQQITSNNNKNNIPMNINNNTNNQTINMNNNNTNELLNTNKIPNKTNMQYKQIQPQVNQKINNNFLVNPAIISENPSFNTAPVPRNITKIPNMDNTDFQKSLNFESFKHKTFDKLEQNRLSSSSSEEENDDEDISEENNQGDQPYRFKNLITKRPKKIKGNLEKFKKNQNMGDYVPAGTKFVSYLKFPSTKINTNQSMTASTISSSLTSGSNRVIGIEKNIIKNPGELDEITTRIQRILKKRNIKYKLLYRATNDGDFSSKFHEKCDNIPNTLVLIETSGERRFGGFTTQTWDGDDVNKKDNNCFIFSIDNMKTYDINENQFAINCNPDLGPVFVNQIKLLDKFFIQGGSTNKKGKTFSTLEDFEITGGAEKFGVREVEVYQVK